MNCKYRKNFFSYSFFDFALTEGNIMIIIFYNYTLINPANTSVYFYRRLEWRQINVREIFFEGINVSYGQRLTVFTDCNLNSIPQNK